MSEPNYGDLKVDTDLKNVAMDVAESIYGQKYGAAKVIGNEALVLWLLMRGQDNGADAVQDALDDHGFDTMQDLIDAVDARHQQAVDANPAMSEEMAFDPEGVIRQISPFLRALGDQTLDDYRGDA